MAKSDLFKKVRYGIGWDRIIVGNLLPNSKEIRYGYRINISMETEEDIEEIKKFLEKNHVSSYEDKIATSFSPTVAPGDRTLRVIYNKQSIANLEKMWKREQENSLFGRSIQASRGCR